MDLLQSERDSHDIDAQHIGSLHAIIEIALRRTSLATLKAELADAYACAKDRRHRQHTEHAQRFGVGEDGALGTKEWDDE